MKTAATRCGVVLTCFSTATLIFVSCASRPQEEIASTQAAVQGLATDDVLSYASESFRAAQDAMVKADAELRTQDSRFFFSRDYRATSELLKMVRDQASRTRAEAQTNKAKAKANAEAVIGALPDAIEKATKALHRASNRQDMPGVFDAMQSDLKSAQESRTGAARAISDGRYDKALREAEGARDKLVAISEHAQFDQGEWFYLDMNEPPVSTLDPAANPTAITIYLAAKDKPHVVKASGHLGGRIGVSKGRLGFATFQTSPGAMITIRLSRYSPAQHVVILGKPYTDGVYYVDRGGEVRTKERSNTGARQAAQQNR